MLPTGNWGPREPFHCRLSKSQIKTNAEHRINVGCSEKILDR